jgi:hypothetical protein
VRARGGGVAADSLVLPRLGRALALGAVLVALMLAAGPARAATCPGPCQTIDSNPLVVKVSADTAIQVFYGGEPRGQVYPPSDQRGNSGTYVAVDGQLVGPGTFTEISQSGIGGNGSASNPYTVVTVLDVGQSGLRLTETVSLVAGQPFFRIDRRIVNRGGVAKSFSVFHYADFYLRGSDTGFGYFDAPSRSIGGQTPGADFFQVFTPITPPSHYEEGRFSEILSRITGAATGGPPLADTFLPPPDPANNVDNGAALQWDARVPVGGGVTISDFWSFGVTPLVPRGQPLPPDLSRTIPNPQTLRAGPTRARLPGRVSLRSLRRSKCVLVQVATARPARVLVTLFSGRRSVRLFGQALVRFPRPGQRTVCIRVPLRARTFDLRTFLRAALGYKLGTAPRRGEPSPRPTIRPIRLVP